MLRIQHCIGLIKEDKQDPGYRKSIVTVTRRGVFNLFPKASAEWKHPDERNPKKSCLEKSKVRF